jgi:hypothetical protein
MADRQEAARLDAADPNLTWDQTLAIYRGRGLEGNALWQEIIRAAQRSRASVNHILGVTPEQLRDQYGHLIEPPTQDPGEP